MMRSARKPQAACGSERTLIRRVRAAVTGGACPGALVSGLVLALLATAQPAFAGRDPSQPTKGKTTSAFAEPKDGMFGKKQKIDESLPLYLQGDQLIYDTKGNRVIAKGNVQIFYNDNILTADEVIYDQGAGTLTAVGNVELKEKSGNVIHAERYTLTDDFRDGFVQSLSVMTSDQSTITAERAERREGNVSEFTNARFTPCKGANGMPPLWCLSGKKIIHDQQAATIYYQDAYFELFGQPIFYLPYFSHPDPTVKRRSGFLPPEYSYSTDLGYMTEVPYFFDLAPNYDFLFHPMYLTNQGMLWKGDWRHRTEDGAYTIKFAAIDQNADDLPDTVTGDKRKLLDGWRGSVETKGEFSLSSWWKYGWDATIESDDTFRRFYKLDSVLITDRVNKAYVVGQSDRSYLGANVYQFGGLLTNDTPTTESWVHPIVDYNYVFRNPVLGGELRWDSNVMSFSRSELSDVAGSGATGREDINRMVSQLKWRRRLTDTFGITYTPFGELRGDVYQLNNAEDPSTCVQKKNAQGVVIGATCDIVGNETEVRGQVSGGVTVAYPWVANSSAGTHVIEPIGQVVTHQGDVGSQRALPDEDAKSLVFDDTTLFETDKFSGFDRLETGTRINAGVQYTFQANSGGFVRVLAGQSYQVAGANAFSDPGVDPSGNYVYSPTSGLETSTSDYVLGAYVAPVDYFRLVAQSRFDQGSFDLRREDVSMIFQYGPMNLTTTYAFTAADPEQGIAVDQQDVSGAMGLQLTDYWSILGSIRYDIDASQVRTDAVQLRYLDECFMLSATYQESFITNPDLDIVPDKTVMLRFELKHLGGFKYKTDQLDFLFGDAQTTIP